MIKHLIEWMIELNDTRSLLSDKAVFRSRYGVEGWVECLEVSVFSEISSSFKKLSLVGLFQQKLSRAHSGLLVNEVILVNSFYINTYVPYCLEKSGFYSSFSMILTFLAMY